MATDASWIEVDIVLHAGGRVTDWCETLTLGQEVGLHGPSGSKHPKAGWLGLFGDERALPVILRIIEDAPPGTTIEAAIAVRDPDDAQNVTTRAKTKLTWLSMNDHGALTSALATADIPDTNRHIFFAAERDKAAMARAFLKREGVTGAESKAAGYWTAKP